MAKRPCPICGAWKEARGGLPGHLKLAHATRVVREPALVRDAPRYIVSAPPPGSAAGAPTFRADPRTHIRGQLDYPDPTEG